LLAKVKQDDIPIYEIDSVLSHYREHPSVIAE
jgi:hypothetical protein